MLKGHTKLDPSVQLDSLSRAALAISIFTTFEIKPVEITMATLTQHTCK